MDQIHTIPLEHFTLGQSISGFDYIMLCRWSDIYGNTGFIVTSILDGEKRPQSKQNIFRTIKHDCPPDGSGNISDCSKLSMRCGID